MSTVRKLWFLLATRHKSASVALFGLLLVGMVLETLGVGLVIPALAMMTSSNLPAKYPAVARFLGELGLVGHTQWIIAGMLLLVTVYLVKTIFLGFLAWRQARFAYDLQADLSQRLFAGYLRQPYAFHLTRNSSHLIRNALTQVGVLTDVIRQGLLLFAELLVLAGISGMLLVVEPFGAIVVMLVIGIAGLLFHRFTRSHVSRWGVSLEVHERKRVQYLQEGLGGAKDVKLLGREHDFLTQYELHSKGSARLNELNTTIQAFPRLWLEMLGVAGLAALVVVMLAQGKPVELLLPTLGLFAAAAFRLMPSVNRILSAVQQVRFSLPVIDTLYEEIRVLDAGKAPTGGASLPWQSTLSLNKVGFKYPESESFALQDVSLVIQKGSSVGFIGGSGAGKSTLVDILLGLLAPDQGRVSLDGQDIQSNLRGWQDQIGYVPQSIFLTDDTLRRNVAFGLPSENIDEAAVRHAIQAAQLEDFVSSLPAGLDTVVGERGVRLSGGQRQRIGIARALYHDPSVLVLDEATSSLDTETERGVMQAVRALQRAKTVIIVAHRLSTVEHCDRLYRLERGCIVEEGGAAAMIAKTLEADTRIN
jgi:ABC-type multidrug transport system fused ATPase/permease subunit